VCSGSLGGNTFSFPCKDFSGDVAGYTCTGQLPDWPPPSNAAGRFSASAGVVSDSQTGLKWQQTVDANTYVWADAKNYCATLPLAGGGWRLPTLAELRSIVDHRRENPAIDMEAFPGTPSETFYVSDPYIEANRGPLPWLVNFGPGSDGFANANELRRVRCVR
jgi:hypothetical protein